MQSSVLRLLLCKVETGFTIVIIDYLIYSQFHGVGYVTYKRMVDLKLPGANCLWKASETCGQFK